MKKLLNISVIAALAVLPFAANAAVNDVVSTVDPAHADPATVTSTEPGYALATETTNDSKLATAGYVKGAYNATIKAVNKVAATAASAVKTIAEGSTDGTIKVDGTDVAVHGLGSAAFTASTDYISSAAGSVKTANIDDGQVTKAKLAQTVQDSLDAADSALQAADIAEGATNGTISVDGTDVSVHGLGSAAYADTTAFDAAGAASGVKSDIEGKLDDGATGYDIDAKTLKVQGADVLTNSALTDYAKKIGVTHTISSSKITGTVPTVTTWGSETAGTAPITASITGATYTETAPAQSGQ